MDLRAECITHGAQERGRPFFATEVREAVLYKRMSDVEENRARIIVTDNVVQGTRGARHGVRHFRHPVRVEKRQNALVGGRPARRLLSDLRPQGGGIAADDERGELESADQKARRVRAPACPVP